MGPDLIVLRVLCSLSLWLYIVLNQTNQLPYSFTAPVLQYSTSTMRHCCYTAMLFCLLHLMVFIGRLFATGCCSTAASHTQVCVCARLCASHHILSVCFFEHSPGRQLKAGISLSVSAVLKVATCERGRWLAVVSASSLNKCAAVGCCEWRWHESKL